ncbi:tetratricopeptide repeat protein, partial [Candidatus Latescibacterota bacterium]
YKPPNTLKLASNYFVGFAQLTERYLALNDPENAVRATWGALTMTSAGLDNRQLIYQIFATRKYIEEISQFMDWEFSRPGVLNGTEGQVADRLYLCYLLKQLGEGERASEYIQSEEARIDSRSFEARYAFTVELARTNLYDESYAYLTELSHDYPQSQGTLELLMAIAHAIGKYEEALAAANRLVELDSSSKEYRDTRDSLMSLINSEGAGDSLSPSP